MLLAIDTATQYMSMALHDGQSLIAEQLWRTGNKHNELLALSIERMMDACDVTADDLTAVAVSTGPGSYTGLRIGVSMAKGIAATNDLPLVGLSSLDTIALSQPYQNTRHNLLAVVQAGRGRIISASYRAKKGRWTADSEPRLTTWADLLQDLEGTYYITGEVDQNGQNAISEISRESVSLTLVSASNRARRAGFLAQEALRQLENEPRENFDPGKVIPVYLKSE